MKYLQAALVAFLIVAIAIVVYAASQHLVAKRPVTSTFAIPSEPRDSHNWSPTLSYRGGNVEGTTHIMITIRDMNDQAAPPIVLATTAYNSLEETQQASARINQLLDRLKK